MDANERRELFQKMKSKADADLQEKRDKKAKEFRMIAWKLELQKTAANGLNALSQLEKQVSITHQIDNRPAEKLIKGKTKGMRRRKAGPSI